MTPAVVSPYLQPDCTYLSPLRRIRATACLSSCAVVREAARHRRLVCRFPDSFQLLVFELSRELFQYRFNQLTFPSVERRQYPFESRECAFVLTEFGPTGRAVGDLLCWRHGRLTNLQGDEP
jgi:hypothetical protein